MLYLKIVIGLVYEMLIPITPKKIANKLFGMFNETLLGSRQVAPESPDNQKWAMKGDKKWVDWEAKSVENSVKI